MRLLRRLRALVRRDRVDAEMAEELRAHLDLQTAENIARGLSPADARHAALRAFGGVEQIKERARDQRGWPTLDVVFQSIRDAARQLRRNPGFAIAVILTFALSIGACSAIFTVVNSVLLRPIAFAESERLVIVQESHPRYALVAVSPASFRAWTEQADLFESMAVRTGYSYNLVGSGEPVRARIAGVTGRYFELLRVQPAHGRLFGPTEDTPGRNKVAVLTHTIWQRRFGGRPDVIGSAIRLSGDIFTIIGVLPADFRGGEDEIFTPLGIPDQMWQSHGRFFSWVVGRLKPGVTAEQAQEQMNVLATRAAAQFPAWNKEWSARVTPLLEFETRSVRGLLYAVFAAAVVVLMIASVNLANLLLVRAIVRHREISVRAALGASRLRIGGQLLTESLVLAVLGGAFGLAVAKGGMAGLLALAPFDVPRAAEVALDGRAVGFTFVLTLLVGMGVGLVPAWCGAHRNLSDSLKGADRGASAARGARLFRHGFIVAQVALAFMLLTAAGLLLGSFLRLNRADPGFMPEGALMLRVEPQHGTPEKQVQFAETLAARFAALPGVLSVGASFPLPFSGDGNTAHRLDIEGRDVPFDARPGTIFFRVTPDYFRAMVVPLRRGRIFTEHDRAGSLPVAIISESLARRFFPDEDPIGRRIRWDGHDRNTWRTIVGIVGDVRHDGHDGEIVPQNYEPFAQAPSGIVHFVARSEIAPSALAPLLRRELHESEPELPIARLERLDDLVAGSIARQRFAMSLFGIFSGVALLLAAGGIYSVTAYAVAQRTREFGIRIALGAQAVDLRWLVLRHEAGAVGLGLLAGGAGTFWAMRLIETLLYQTPVGDPLVLAANAGLLALSALAASLMPASRAAKVDPMVALRAE